jgi:hypothetical protein
MKLGCALGSPPRCVPWDGENYIWLWYSSLTFGIASSGNFLLEGKYASNEALIEYVRWRVFCPDMPWSGGCVKQPRYPTSPRPGLGKNVGGNISESLTSLLTVSINTALPTESRLTKRLKSALVSIRLLRTRQKHAV